MVMSADRVMSIIMLMMIIGRACGITHDSNVRVKMLVVLPIK